MAPIGGPTGGGQAGFGSGASFTGPAEALEIVGDRCYAYSGLTATSNAEQTTLKFTTGNYYSDCILSMQGAVQMNDLTDGDHTGFIVKLNGAIIGQFKVSTIAEGMPTVLKVPLIIPSYTEVEVITDSYNPVANQFTATLITGRIYRG